jgi:hypothetical protein
MSQMGHSRPVHSVPVPIIVRCYSNSAIIVWRSEVTLRANNRHVLAKRMAERMARPGAIQEEQTASGVIRAFTALRRLGPTHDALDHHGRDAREHGLCQRGAQHIDHRA